MKFHETDFPIGLTPGVPRFPHQNENRDKRRPENRHRSGPEGVERRKGDRRRLPR